MIQSNRISQRSGVGMLRYVSFGDPHTGIHLVAMGWCGAVGKVATQFGTRGQVSTHDQTRIKLLQGSSISANVPLPQGGEAPLGALLLCSDCQRIKLNTMTKIMLISIMFISPLKGQQE